MYLNRPPQRDTCFTMTTDTTLDLRHLAPHDRHTAVFKTCQHLPLGADFVLINDHNPLPLQQQLRLQWNDELGWEVLEAGPAQWRVRIRRQAEPRSCCGGCGGGGH
jgi:uncharacterized protein (DUF2249 family)